MTVLRNVYVTDATTGVTGAIDPNQGQAVNLQDQTSPILIVPFHTTTNTTTLATAATAKEDLTFDVASTTGFTAGQYITIYNIAGQRWYQAYQIGAPAGSTITIDTPFDYEFQVGDQVSVGSADLAVNGSVTTQVFTVRDPAPGGITLVGDITRIILVAELASAASWAEFGDRVALPNGLVMRKVDGTYQNIFNVKTNKQLANIMYDFDILLATGPALVDGIKGRLTFGGQNKIGVVIRLQTGEDLQLLVQDDLSTFTSFQVYAEGHLVVGT